MMRSASFLTLIYRMRFFSWRNLTPTIISGVLQNVAKEVSQQHLSVPISVIKWRCDGEEVMHSTILSVWLYVNRTTLNEGQIWSYYLYGVLKLTKLRVRNCRRDLRETNQISCVEIAQWTFLIVPTFDSQYFA